MRAVAWLAAGRAVPAAATAATISAVGVSFTPFYQYVVSIIGSMVYFGNPVLLRTYGISYRFLTYRQTVRNKVSLHQ
jgi:hypothetical protein